MKKSYVLNVKLEHTVRALLSGFTTGLVDPNNTRALIHNANINPLAAVHVGTYHAISEEIDIASDIKSACALQGVKAQDILDALLKMRMVDTITGKKYPAVDVDKNPPSGHYPYSSAVTSLEAVYTACSYVLHKKTLREHKALKPVLAAKKVRKQHKPKSNATSN